jgi:hypothetical protein
MTRLMTRLDDVRIGRFAWVMAWFGLVAGQLHALARHNTVDGKEDLQSPLTSFWSDPARKALSPLLDWGTPDQVYLTYGKVWLPVFVAFTLCAFAVHRRRTPYGFEKWAWRIALTGYVWACLAVFGDYWLQWGTHDWEPLLTIAFVAGLPGLVLTLLGSSVLGIALLRRGCRPRLSAWLLTLAFPLAIAIQTVTSLGNVALPVAFAFGLAGHRFVSAPERRKSQQTADESVAAA